MKLKDIWGLLKATFADWSEDKASRLAAALAYYTVFSIVPMLIICIAIAGLVFGREAAQGEIVRQIGGLIGEESAQQVQAMIANASKPSSGITATVIGIGTLLFGASGVFGQLQDGLNTIWEVQPKPGRGIMGMIKDRFLSFTMVLGVGFMLLVSLVLSAGLAALANYLNSLLPGIAWISLVASFIISFGVVTLLFAMIYKVLPDVKIGWGDVWIGAAATALLFTIGKFLIGLYLGRSNIGSTYGAAGALVIILIWIYYSAQILFLGAEFTQVYANKYGSRIVPDKDAVPVTEEARAEQGLPRKEEGAAAGSTEGAKAGEKKGHTAGEAADTTGGDKGVKGAQQERSGDKKPQSQKPEGHKPEGQRQPQSPPEFGSRSTGGAAHSEGAKAATVASPGRAIARAGAAERAGDSKTWHFVAGIVGFAASLAAVVASGLGREKPRQ